jgi:hypothetical protein
MGNMLVQLQVRREKFPEFVEVMTRLCPILEKSGWKLLGAYRTVIGRYYECFDLWEIPGGAGQMMDVIHENSDDTEVIEIAGRLADFLEFESTRYMEKLPYSP